MIHVKVSILITKGIKTMYSFETEKGRRNEKMGGFFNRKMRKKEKSRTNRDTEQDGRNKSKYVSKTQYIRLSNSLRVYVRRYKNRIHLFAVHQRDT